MRGSGSHEATLAERDRSLAELRQRLTASETQLGDMRERLSQTQVAKARKEQDLEVGTPQICWGVPAGYQLAQVASHCYNCACWTS